MVFIYLAFLLQEDLDESVCTNEECREFTRAKEAVDAIKVTTEESSNQAENW